MNRHPRRSAPLAVLLTLTGAVIVNAQQTTPPAPAAPRAAQMPAPVERTLPNGMRVIVVQKKTIPLVSAQLLVGSGSESDPEQRAGLADITAQMLTRGTTSRAADEIARDIEALGGTLSARAAWDASRVSLTVLSANFAPALQIVSEVVRRPTFKADELARLQEQRKDNLKVALSDPGTLAFVSLPRALYGSGAYAHAAGGTPESLERITRDDVVAFHAQHYRPDRTILVVAGDVVPDDVFKLAELHFGAWNALGAVPRAATVTLPSATSTRAIAIDMPEAGQAAVVLARVGLRRNDPQYYTSLVANSILGGGFSSRLNLETRIRRGLTYGAFSNFDYRGAEGPFSAAGQTKNESAGEVASIFLDEMARLGTDTIPDAELTPRKAYVIGSYGRSMETSSGIVSQVANLALYGIEVARINDFVPRVEAVTAADIRSFAATHLRPAGSLLLIVGDAKGFAPDLRKRFPDLQVVPVDRLDLERPTLTKPPTS